MKTIIAWTTTITLTLAALAFAGVPRTINYQGYVTDKTTNVPLNSNAVGMTFSLYSSANPHNNPVWRETQSPVDVKNGIFSVHLGSVVPITAPFDVPYRLGVNVNGSGELPLQPLSSVPYAQRAVMAENVSSTGNINFQAGGQSVIRIEPNATSPNIAVGNPANVAGGTGVTGATVSGGGAAGATCLNLFMSPASCINTASAIYATVGGGIGNTASKDYATVGGGYLNTASENAATVGGGYFNNARGLRATVAGGVFNYADGALATVGGGYFNNSSADNTTVGGGFSNVASGVSATTGGGYGNYASGESATSGGGENNAAIGNFATVSGGSRNIASGSYATVVGGAFNQAGGNFSFAGGNRARVRNTSAPGADIITGDQGTFIWADSTAADFQSTGQNQFLIRAAGGVGINTNTPGFTLDVNGTGRVTTNFDLKGGTDGVAQIGFNRESTTGVIYNTAHKAWQMGTMGNLNSPSDNFVVSSWNTDKNHIADVLTMTTAGNANFAGTVSSGGSTLTSDLRLKTDIQPLEGTLTKVLNLRGVSYVMKADEAKERKIGVIAQELEQEYPELVATDSQGMKSVAYANLTAVLIEAVKGLKAENDALKADNKTLKIDYDSTKMRLERLEQLLITK